MTYEIFPKLLFYLNELGYRPNEIHLYLQLRHLKRDKDFISTKELSELSGYKNRQVNKLLCSLKEELIVTERVGHNLKVVLQELSKERLNLIEEKVSLREEERFLLHPRKKLNWYLQLPLEMLLKPVSATNSKKLLYAALQSFKKNPSVENIQHILGFKNKSAVINFIKGYTRNRVLTESDYVIIMEGKRKLPA